LDARSEVSLLHAEQGFFQVHQRARHTVREVNRHQHENEDKHHQLNQREFLRGEKNLQHVNSPPRVPPETEIIIHKNNETLTKFFAQHIQDQLKKHKLTLTNPRFDPKEKS
jgi:hypothetical protein